MASSADYWKAREKEALKRNQKIEKEEYDKQIEDIYQQMTDDCSADIQKFYARYAAKEGITLADAKKRADELDIEEYGRKAKKYVAEKNFSDQANEEMRLYNMTMRTNRLELLKSELSLEMIAGTDKYQDLLSKALPERAKDSYKRQAGILGKSVPNAKTLGRMMDTIVHGSFKNATFSERIWVNMDALRDAVNTELTRGLIRGLNPRVLARNIENRFHSGRYNAERLMRTELARVQIGAQEQAISDAGYDAYQFLCVSSACEDCQALDGKTFKLSKMIPGENAPPLHPNCRCSVCAAMSDEEFRKLTGVDPAELDLKAINQAAVEKSKAENTKAESTPMYRHKEYTNRKQGASGFKKIDKPLYNKLTRRAIRKGADIRIADESWKNHLKQNNASAVTIGKTIIFTDEATVTDVLEEIHHFYQNKNGLNSNYSVRERTILNEIDAKKYLLSVKNKYKIPIEETTLTEHQLESYMAEMKKLKEAGDWNEGS